MVATMAEAMEEAVAMEAIARTMGVAMLKEEEDIDVVENPRAKSATSMDMMHFAVTPGSIMLYNQRPQIGRPTTPTSTMPRIKPGTWTPEQRTT